jgi:cytosine permease
MTRFGLPNYVASAAPLPLSRRIPWYLSTAQTYAGVMLWFVFWQDVPVGSGLSSEAGQYSAFAGGVLSHGLPLALAGVIIAAFLCCFAFYLAPALLGLKSGFPLYIVGTSTYGVLGGFLMPGFLMGLLQFGWLGVSSFFSALLLCGPFGFGPLTPPHLVVAALWAIAAAFVGLKGIRHVARVATFAPIVPVLTLLVLGVGTFRGLSRFEPQAIIDAGLSTAVTLKNQTVLEAGPALSAPGVLALILTYIVGFFATAGAAGADFGMNNRHAKDVLLGGLTGIALTTIVAGGLALLIVAGGHGLGLIGDGAVLRATSMLPGVIGPRASSVLMWLLALAAFPSSCFSTLIAANSFKATLPKINPFVSVGLGTLASIAIAVSGWAGNLIPVFTIIGASFGPICGAMAADYLLAGRKWPGPRAGFNPAGWISWALGFVAGISPFIPGWKQAIPAPPVAALIIGFLAYAILAKAGLLTRSLIFSGTSQTSPPSG